MTYLATLLAVLWAAAREALSAADVRRRSLVAVVAAYDVGVLALCFSYAPFMSATGIEFWLLNGVVLYTSPAFQRGAGSRPFAGTAPA